MVSVMIKLVRCTAAGGMLKGLFFKVKRRNVWGKKVCFCVCAGICVVETDWKWV